MPQRRSFHHGWLGLALVVGFSSCKKGDEVVWEQFNWDRDEVEVHVRPNGISGEVATTELWSAVAKQGTGDPIGAASVDPAAGPVGTEHEVLVLVDQRWEELVQRVTLEVDSGVRGVFEVELRQDPAYLGTWGTTVKSLGAPNEERTDLFRFVLWTPMEEDSVVEEEGQ